MTKKIIPQIFHFFKPYYKHYAVMMVFIFTIQSVGLILPYMLAKIASAITNRDIVTSIYYVAGSFLLSIVSSVLLSLLRDRYDVKYLDMDRNVHVHSMSLNKLLGFSIGQYRHQNSGIKQSVISQGESGMIGLVEGMFYEVIPTLVKFLVTLVLITLISLWVGLFIFFVMGLYIFLAIRKNLNYYKNFDERMEIDKNVSKIQSEIYRHAPLIILEGQENKMKNISYEIEMESVIGWRKIVFPWMTETAIQRILINFSQYGSLLLVIYFIFQGLLEPAMFIAFFAWISQSTNGIESVTNSQRRFMFQIARVRKYFEILNIETDVPMPINPQIPEDFKGKIEFKNVSYSYLRRDDDKTIQKNQSISNLSFTINPGEKIGIVGVSGAGKSTLVNLLRRAFDPQSGEILIDGISLKEIDLHWLRSQFGNVEQDIPIFDLTVKDNILFGVNGRAKDITENQLYAVARLASIDDFIKNLEKGFDTLIGERGIKISPGERQRIAIARALIKDPRILIFDEATSSLDAHNEDLIHKSLQKSVVGRTAIIIAHRLSTVIDSDRIFVMDKGKLVDSGTHVELQKRCSAYQKLIKNQLVIV